MKHVDALNRVYDVNVIEKYDMGTLQVKTPSLVKLSLS